jgi:hypothetical protein
MTSQVSQVSQTWPACPPIFPGPTAGYGVALCSKCNIWCNIVTENVVERLKNASIPPVRQTGALAKLPGTYPHGT